MSIRGQPFAPNYKTELFLRKSGAIDFILRCVWLASHPVFRSTMVWMRCGSGNISETIFTWIVTWSWSHTMNAKIETGIQNKERWSNRTTDATLTWYKHRPITAAAATVIVSHAVRVVSHMLADIYMNVYKRNGKLLAGNRAKSFTAEQQHNINRHTSTVQCL